MKILYLLLMAPLAWGLSNKVRIHDAATLTHTGEPITVSRVLADNEFCGTYPQPYVSGVASALWQVDILNTWPTTGCLRQVKVSFFASIASGSFIDVDFRPNANQTSTGSTTPLTKAAMLAFNASGWGAKIQGTASGVVKSASARTILGAVSECPAGEWASTGCFKYLLQGPVVTQIMLFGGTDNSFGWECDSSISTCPAVSPYTATGWKDPTDVKYNSIHPIWVISFYTGWAGVKTEFIWENVWFGRLQDLKFDLELFNGAAESTSVYTSAGLVTYALRRAREVFWDGATPAGFTSQYRPGIRIDFGRQYMLYSKTVPFQMPDVNTIGSLAASYDYNSTAGNLDLVHNIGTATEAQFCGAGTGTTCGPQSYSWPAGGAKPELAPISRSYSRYMASWSSDLYEVVLQLGLMAGAFPLHVRESTTSRTYTSGSAVNAFGKPISLDARPLISLATNQTNAPAGSKFVMGDGVVGTITCAEPTRSYQIGCTNTVNDPVETFNKWVIDDAHPPRAAYIPYIFTGDEYLREEQMFATSQVEGTQAAGSTITPGCNFNFARHGEAGVGNDWGYPSSPFNIRVEAWSTLHHGQTVLSLLSSSPEWLYYNSRMQKIIDVRRGRFGIAATPADYNPGGSSGDPCPSGSYNASLATPWCWGFRSMMEGRSNPISLTSIQGTYTGYGLMTTVGCASNQWFENYVRTVYGMLNDFGLTQFEPLLALVEQTLIKQAIQQGAYGAAVGDYSAVMRDASTNNPVTTVAQFNTYIRTETTLRASVTAVDTVIPLSHQVVSVNCTVANSIWMGGITKWVIDPGLPTEEFIELNASPTCQAPGTYTVTPQRRGVMGTAAQAHSAGAVVRRALLEYGSTSGIAMDAGYGNIANGAFSFAVPYSATDEVTGLTLSGQRAWEEHFTMNIYQNYLYDTSCSAPFITPANCQNFMWAFRPRHLIQNTRNIISGTSATFWYTAPTGDACTYGLSTTPFSNSDSTGDTATTGASRARTFTASGLSSATTYYYRITCGPHGGTARVYGTINIP